MKQTFSSDLFRLSARHAKKKGCKALILTDENVTKVERK